MKTAVILSPHLDDAVISCWHLLNLPRSILVTVFAGLPKASKTSVWDRLCGEPNSNKMMKRRLQENAKALETMPVRLHNLKYLDRQYDHGSRDIAGIAQSILKQVSGEVHFFAPLAGGRLWNHPDHVTLRRVGQYLIDQGEEVSFYADIPYMQMPARTRRYSSKRAESIVGAAVTATVGTLSEQEQAGKYRALRAYKSQYTMLNLVSFGTLKRKANLAQEITFAVS